MAKRRTHKRDTGGHRHRSVPTNGRGLTPRQESLVFGEWRSERERPAQRPHPVTIYYHGHCPDGATSAMIIEDFYKKLGRQVTTVPIKPNNLTNPRAAIGAMVFMVDVCVSRDVLLVLRDLAKTVRVIDHHETSIDACEGLDWTRVDTKKSASLLVWEAFHKTKEPTALVKYVNDMDLYTNALPNSKPIQQLLRDMTTPSDARTMSLRMDREFDVMVKQGNRLLKEQEDWIEDAIKNHSTVALLGDEVVVAVELSSGSADTSDLANELARRNGKVGVVWYKRGDGTRLYSLRSEPGVGVNVATLAETFGGGGHKHAAGIASKTQILEFEEK